MGEFFEMKKEVRKWSEPNSDISQGSMLSSRSVYDRRIDYDCIDYNGVWGKHESYPQFQ